MAFVWRSPGDPWRFILDRFHMTCGLDLPQSWWQARLVDNALLAPSYREHLQELEARYARVLAAAGLDALVLHAGAPQLRSSYDDQYWPLRVTPHFQHWLPLAAAESALVIRSGQKPRLIWFDEPNFWEKPPAPEGDFWQDGFEFVRVRSRDELDLELKAQLPRDGRWKGVGAERNAADPQLVAALDALRVEKTAYEELCIAEANRRAAVGHDALRKAFGSDDASEFELHLLFLRATGQDDPETPYKNIVALGENAATLHHITYGRTAPVRASGGGGSSLLVDAGAACFGYCSDITRTYVKGDGAAANAFTGLLSEMQTLQQQLVQDVKVGDRYEALHDRAHDYVAHALREVGVIKSSEAEAVSNGLTRAFFPHGLGHSLGLQCHDVGCASIKPRPDNPFLRNTAQIAERQCFTIEPGIYFIPSLLAPVRQGGHAADVDWRLVDQLAALGGIRIEDDVMVVGGRTITRNVTRQFLPA